MLDLNELNEAQRQAVECIDAPSLVIAGAGSGKTRVLTYKVAYLLEKGMAPWNILALTFTNKAAREMRERIAKQVGEEKASALWMGTFHSIFARILRQESAVLGLNRDFTIYDTTDSRSLVRSIIKEMGLDEKTYKPAVVAGRISMAKNHLLLPQQYGQTSVLINSDRAAKIPATVDVYQRYFERCRASHALDFDDLLLYTWLLFSRFPDVLRRYEERFHFVLVDEYQDTNYAQHQIVWLLTQHRQRVSVVGDDAQSIYSFRGANIDNILRFREKYSGARLFKLEQNYRSTQTIVSAASRLIRNNRGQIPKEVFSENDKGEPIRYHNTYSDLDEANVVMKSIKSFNAQKGISFSDIAVLYRTNAQSRSFEESLRKNNIPYRIYGSLSFYQRKEIKDVTAYFRLAVNPYDEESLRRVINYPARGIGQNSLEKLFNYASEKHISPWEAMHNIQEVNVNNGIRSKITDFCNTLEQFHQLSETSDSYELAKHILVKSGLQEEIMKGREPEDISRQENVQELIDGIVAFVAERQEQGLDAFMSDYLQEVSLLSDFDENVPESDEHVNLMTVHSAKGLEFRVVFVVGMEEELFPSQMALESHNGLEEERRLFYVAMTRAKEILVLTNAKSRFRYGKMENLDPSRFLREIGVGKVSFQMPVQQTSQQHVPTFTRRMTPVSSVVPASSTSSATALSVGMHIQHERFGKGEVVATEGAGIDAKATVNFENVGTKQLLLRFAKYTVL